MKKTIKFAVCVSSAIVIMVAITMFCRFVGDVLAMGIVFALITLYFSILISRCIDEGVYKKKDDSAGNSSSSSSSDCPTSSSSSSSSDSSGSSSSDDGTWNGMKPAPMD